MIHLDYYELFKISEFYVELKTNPIVPKLKDVFSMLFSAVSSLKPKPQGLHKNDDSKHQISFTKHHYLTFCLKKAILLYTFLFGRFLLCFLSHLRRFQNIFRDYSVIAGDMVSKHKDDMKSLRALRRNPIGLWCQIN